ncbi:cation/H antiporter [Trifolium repens]|nr:cation/H antiporter [Trifolium repens]
MDAEEIARLTDAKLIDCYLNRIDNPGSIWNSENVLLLYLPNLIIQIFLVVVATRVMYGILRPLNQPHFVAELLAGFVLNIYIPIMDNTPFGMALKPKGILGFETLSQLGVIYYVFVTGLEMNLETLLRARKKASTIAIVGTIIPMILGFGIYFLVEKSFNKKNGEFNKISSYLLWSLVVTITSFPVVAHILSDLKILYTGLGRVALTSATINDFINWAMFIFLIPLIINGKRGIVSVILTIVFSNFCYFVLRPPLNKILVEKTEENEWDLYQLSYVLVGVIACATVTEFLGTHSVVGALIFGLILPRGKFTEMLIEQSEDIGSGYLAPLFFASIVATRFYGMPIRDGMALGVIMNTKGILSLIILNIGWNRKVVSEEAFTIMVFSIFFMTVVVAPIINAMYKPRVTYEQNKLRTIENLKADSEIRVMACVHNVRQANGMIHFLEACNGPNVSLLHVFALQLVELKGRATALLVAQIDQRHQSSSLHDGLQSGDQSSETNNYISNHIANVFEEYSSNNANTLVENLVAMSSFSTIHRDIYNLALEKQASLVLLPFHKQNTAESALEVADPGFRDINQNVMQDAPCSVGIFVDRGHHTSLFKTKMRILMIFIGGPDDREALAIAWRMSKHPWTRLTMVRIILCGKAAEVESKGYSEGEGLLSTVLDTEKQKEWDEEYVNSFRLKAVNNEDTITYAEREVHTDEDISEVLNELDKGGFDLHILGHGRGRNSLVLSNLLEWADCPELGVIGDMLASNSFGSNSSILVVQQYGFGGVHFKTKSQNDDIESLFPKGE